MSHLPLSAAGVVPWQPFLIPGIGLAAAAVALVVGLLLARRNPAPARPPEGGPGPEQRPVADTDPFVHGSARERREAARRSGNPLQVELRDEAGAPLDEVLAWVIDRSVGGLCLSANGPLEPGVRLELRPAHASPLVPWVQVEVRTCRREGTAWEVGCRFVKTPPYSVLLQFG